MKQLDGKKLKMLREGLKITQANAAKALDKKMPGSTYSGKEKRSDFTESELEKLSVLFKMPLKNFLHEVALDPTITNFEGSVLGNQIRAMAFLQTILEANAEIIAQYRQEPATSALSRLLKMAEQKEESLRKELK